MKLVINSSHKIVFTIAISTLFVGLWVFINFNLQKSLSWTGPVPNFDFDTINDDLPDGFVLPDGWTDSRRVAQGCVVESVNSDGTHLAIGRLKSCGEGHLVCPKGTTNNNSCQNCTCAGCSFRWEEINGKTVRRCNRPEYNNVPICCTPNKTVTPTPVVTATPKPTLTPRPTKTPTAPGCVTNITCSKQCGLPYRCTNDGCGGQKCCGATTPCTQPTPTSTPVQTPTMTPTSTPTQGEPNYCGGTCGSNYNCQAGYFCYIENGKKSGFCRNPICSGESDCNCKSAPTAPPVLGSTTTTVLPKTGGGIDFVAISLLTGGLGMIIFKKLRSIK